MSNLTVTPTTPKPPEWAENVFIAAQNLSSTAGDYVNASGTVDVYSDLKNNICFGANQTTFKTAKQAYDQLENACRIAVVQDERFSFETIAQQILEKFSQAIQNAIVIHELPSGTGGVQFAYSFLDPQKRSNPGRYVILIDRSGSMSGQKIKIVEEALNALMTEFVLTIGESDSGQIKDSALFSIIGYQTQAQRLCNSTENNGIASLSHLTQSALDNDRTIKYPNRDDVLNIFQLTSGGETAMGSALRMGLEDVNELQKEKIRPAVVFNITDGAPSDDGYMEAAAAIQKTGALMCNCYIDPSCKEAISFPESENELQTSYAKTLFKMSSWLPEEMLERAKNLGLVRKDQTKAKAFIFGANAELLLKFFSFGTQAQL